MKHNDCSQFAVHCSLLLALALFSGCCTENCPKDSGTTFAKDAIGPMVERGEIPGFISIFYHDGLQETTCLGYADPRTKRPITLDDHYMQCSQTKGFCGVTIAKLVEEGKISLDDPVSKYIPKFGEMWIRESNTNGVQKLVKAKNAITVRMVMNHTAGFPFELPEFGAMGGWSRKMPLRSVAIMAASLPLLFEPGTRCQYSNTGIDVGAAVVEVVTGKRWEEYLQETVLDPLGMTETTFYPTEAQLADRIELGKLAEGKPSEWVRELPSMAMPYGDDRVFASAGAGLWTTARDQLKFYKMLMNLGLGDNGARILKEETVKSILAVSTRPKGTINFNDGKTVDDSYSLGLVAPQVDGEDAWFGHGGAWQTNCMVNWHRKELKLVAVQFTGMWNHPYRKAKDEAADRFFKRAIDNSGADAYTGRMN